MRKNLAILCLGRFKLWMEKAKEARVARRANYGGNRKLFANNHNKEENINQSGDNNNSGEGGKEGDGEGKKVVAMLTKSTQVVGPVHSAPRFFLKIVQ